MISFFPDLNVWLALSVSSHSHSSDAWSWLTASPQGSKLIFSRYTHIGLLRLLTNPSVMGEQTLTIYWRAQYKTRQRSSRSIAACRRTLAVAGIPSGPAKSFRIGTAHQMPVSFFLRRDEGSV